MKVLEQRCDVVALPCRTNEPCSSIHHRLQSVELIACHASQRRIAVIQVCQYQGNHQRLQSLLWDWSTNAADLTQYAEAAGHGSGNMRLHWCIGVDVSSANLRCRSETCCTRLTENTGHNKSPKNHHLGTIAQLFPSISLQVRHISTAGKNLLNSNISPTCPYNMVNFIRPTSGWDRFLSLRHPS